MYWRKVGYCWLDKVTEAYKDSEAPERYFWWAALAVISATVRKRVFLDRFYYKLYPNMYILLVSARSGLRKGIPISVASDLLNEIQCTRVISGRNSIQAIIKELSLQRTLENGIVLNEAQGILLTDEFRSFLVSDDDALTILTSLYNTHEHKHGWKNTLKNSPIEALKNPCVTMLAASNERLLEDILQEKDIEGGFVARSSIVHEHKRNTINDLTERPTDVKPMSELINPLKEMVKIEGEFQWTQEAKDVYRPWYKKICEMDIEDRTGTMERLGDQVLKVAMNVSIAKRLDLQLTAEDIEEAIDKSEDCVLGAKNISIGQGKIEIAAPCAKVLKELIKAPGQELSRLRLLKRCWPTVDQILLDKVIDYLTATKTVETFRDRKEGVIYRMTPETYKQYTKFKG